MINISVCIAAPLKKVCETKHFELTCSRLFHRRHSSVIGRAAGVNFDALCAFGLNVQY